MSIEGCSSPDDDAVAARIHDLEDGSIYDGPGRLAQPDEVWNYGSGDGVEKALLLATAFRARWQIEISAIYIVSEERACPS